MDLIALKALISADSSLTALANAGNDIGVADSLNSKNISVHVQFQLTTLKVMDVLGPIRGTTVMASIRADATYNEIVKLMDDINAGVNLNHPDADTMFGMLITSNILTQAESDQILALRNSMISLAEQQLGRDVTHLEIAEAWRNN